MPLDTSIYQNQHDIQPELMNPLDVAQKAMSLKSLGLQYQQAQMQNQQSQIAMQQQQALRQAYIKNTDSNGSVNKQGVLSDLGKMGFGQSAVALGEQFSAQDKSAAEAQAKQVEAAQQRDAMIAGHLDYLKNVPDEQKGSVYANIRSDLIKKGIISPKDVPEQYDAGLINQIHGMYTQNKPYLENQKIQAEIGKTKSEIAMAPAKLNADLYGSRSPNAELTSQYDKQAQPIRGSQVAMNQMIDNYNNPSPQGDKSLVLNAFKIKFPNAPDVNSIEELTKAQSAPDTWKAMAAHALEGGLDKGTRDNLMRDGVSTFRANVDSLKGIQSRYQARAKQQNVNDPTLTSEPAVDKTYSDALELQKKIGPYVPPSERGGFMAGVNRLASKIVGVGGSQNATAGDTIKMMSPDGKIKMVPIGMKGEAIAAGGKVIQ